MEGPSADASKMADWSRLLHIGAHGGGIEFRPALDELGIDEVHRCCDRAWAYSRSDFEPSLEVPTQTSQWRETCALAGSMAESVMLATASYIEAEWHSRLIAAGKEPAGMALAQRHLADVAIDSAVSVGHRLINFVARVVRTTPEGRVELAKKFPRLDDTYLPFVTDDKHAWLSLSAETVNQLRSVAPDAHRGSITVLTDLVRSQSWQSLVGMRGENFHRWRKEHESVVGVDRDSGRVRDIVDAEGRVTGKRYYAESRPHTVGRGLTERTTRVAGDGLRTIATSLESVITDTLEILPQLAHGYRLEIDYSGKSRTIHPLTAF